MEPISTLKIVMGSVYVVILVNKIFPVKFFLCIKFFPD